jgi:predicted permease
MSDLRYALRMFGRNRSSNVLILVLLAVGIGASTAIFAVFDAILMRPLPVKQPEQLVRLVQYFSPKYPPNSNFAYAYYQALRGHAGTLQYVFGETGEGHFRLTEPGPAAEVTVHAVTPEFFAALGVEPFRGRVLMRDDVAAAVLSYRFWRGHFSGDPAGKTIVINGHRFAVVGVMPAEFNGISADNSPDVRIPLAAYRVFSDGPIEASFFELAARLKPGVSMAQAQAECLALWQSAMRVYYTNVRKESADVAASYVRRGVVLQPLARGTSVLRDRVADILKLLMAVVTLLVLIIGLNVAGLLMVRAAGRQREMAVRLAIGASPVLLARQIVVESLLLALFAAAGAVCVALILTPVSLRMLPPVRSLDTSLVPISLAAGIDSRSLEFLLGLTGVTTVLFTVSPLLASMRVDVERVLRTVRASANLRGRRLLITLQIALCTFLLIGAGQLARSFQNLAGTDTGFAKDFIATFTCDLEGQKTTLAFVRDLMERVKQLPGVVDVATSSIGVMREHGRFANIAPAGQRVTRAYIMSANSNDVSASYFHTMGMRFLEGRDFLPIDGPAPKQPVKAIVNEAFVRRFFPDVEPLGKRFGSAAEGTLAQPDCQIIGVVSDAKYRSLKDPIRPMYFTLQTDFEAFVLNVRTGMQPAAIIRPVERLAPELPFLEEDTLAHEVEETTAPERMMAVLASLFGIAAAMLAGIGTYGLLSYSVKQRRREIGIRMAVGARTGHVAKLVAQETLAMTLGGVAMGAGAAIPAGAAIRSLLYGVPPHDGVSFAGAVLLVGVVAMAATVAPVLNATRVQPSEALRLED